MLRTATLLVLTAFALPASAGAQAPSLSVDTFFAPPSGIADGDFSPTNIIPDVPAAVAVHGDRIYTVGRTGSSISADIGIIARRADGTFDAGFSQDGKLVIPVAAGSEEDDARGIVVLADGRIRILGTTRASTNKDLVVIGLEPDGDPDATFGTVDGRGNRTVVLAGTGEDAAGRITLGADGRLAIVGSRRVGSSDDLVVALLEANGAPADGFGTNGVKVVPLGGGAVNDRGADVAFRPGGGLVVLSALDSPDRALLYAVDGHGNADPGFGSGGQLTIDGGGTSTLPGGLVEHGGALYASGHTTAGSDDDAFVARIDAAGAGVQRRRFDVRGRFVPAGQAAKTQAAEVVVAPGAPPTLVVVGTVVYASDADPEITDWAAAAFNGFESDITQAGYGDLVIPAPGDGGLAAVAGGDGWVAVAGRHVFNADDGFGNARLLIDADKACDLGVNVAEPAELIFRGLAPARLTARVTNVGTRPCGGTLTVPAPYAMTPVETGTVAPGATFEANAVPIAFRGARRADDVLLVSLDAPGDTNAANNRAAAHVVFSFCDLGLEPVGRPGLVPSEGKRRFPVTLRNSGTIACRVGIGSKPRYSLRSGQSVADKVPAGAPRGARRGTRAAIVLRAAASGDVNEANNSATVRARVVGVGDSDVRTHGARRFAGKASSGRGTVSRKRLRPVRVDVAVLRKGARGCAWLRSPRGGFKAGKPRAGGGCEGRRWIRAKGTRRWRLRLAAPLPAGRYVVFSRTTIAAGFAEARFSTADRNRVEFRVR